MATASPNPIPPTNHSPRGAVGSPNLNSPRSRRTAAARGVPSPRTQFARGVDSDLMVSPSVSSVATSTVAAISATAPSSSSSSSAAVVHEQFLCSSDGSPSEVVDVAGVSPSCPSSAVVLSSLDYSNEEAQPESSENGGGISNAAKKPVWGKPSNGAVEVGAVMGAVSWPALSESTRASPKSSSSSSSDSLKALGDGSVSPSKGPGAAASSQRQVANNTTNPNSTTNHVGPTRQRSMKRGGGSSANSVSENGVFSQAQQSPQGLVMEVASNNSGKTRNAAGEFSSRDHTPEVGGQRGHFGSQSHSGNEQQRGHFGSQSYSGNEHQQQRNTFRRGSGAPHSRGDGSYHHSHVGRRDHDRGNQDWNPNRGFSSRDPHMQPQRVFPRGFIRPPPHSSAPFIPPPVPMRPFGNPMHYHEVAPPLIYVPGPTVDSIRGVPMVTPMPPAMFFPVPQLHALIVKQIDYYFSNENLIKDTYLRQKMDGQGWVSIELIAGFKKVTELTNSVKLVLEALQTSNVVEVQGNKVRKRNDWMRWIMPPSMSSTQPLERSSHDKLATQLERASLDENTTHAHFGEYLSRSSSGGLNNQADSAAQTTIYTGDEGSISNRN